MNVDDMNMFALSKGHQRAVQAISSKNICVFLHQGYHARSVIYRGRWIPKEAYSEYFGKYYRYCWIRFSGPQIAFLVRCKSSEVLGASVHV